MCVVIYIFEGAILYRSYCSFKWFAIWREISNNLIAAKIGIKINGKPLVNKKNFLIYEIFA